LPVGRVVLLSQLRPLKNENVYFNFYTGKRANGQQDKALNI
jgi:hypothetical protein